MGISHFGSVKIRSNSNKIQSHQIERFSKVGSKRKAHAHQAKKAATSGGFAKVKMVREFDDAVWSIPVASTSDPVKTQFGYRIWVHERDE